MVERQPSKLNVAGSSPVSRSSCTGSVGTVRLGHWAHVAQSVEHLLGKEEVTGSSPVVGSRLDRGIPDPGNGIGQ